MRKRPSCRSARTVIGVLVNVRFDYPVHININTGDKIMVLTEERRAKLMAARRRALEALPGPTDSQVVPSWDKS